MASFGVRPHRGLAVGDEQPAEGVRSVAEFANQGHRVLELRYVGARGELSAVDERGGAEKVTDALDTALAAVGLVKATIRRAGGGSGRG